MLLNFRCASGVRPVRTTAPSASSSNGLGSPFTTSTHMWLLRMLNMEIKFCACKNFTNKSNEYCATQTRLVIQKLSRDGIFQHVFRLAQRAQCR